MSVDPLPTGQQLFLQRLMAQHVMADEDARKLFEEIVVAGNAYVSQSQSQSQEDLTMGDATTLEECLENINASLVPGFGLEIVTMIDSDNTQYHAVIDKMKVAESEQEEAQKLFLKSWNPSERQFVTLILNAMVQDPNLSLKRADCINLRSDLDETKGFKLGEPEARRVVQLLLDEEWLRISSRQDDDDEDNVDKENNSDDDEEVTPSQQTTKKRKRRRESVQNKLEIAPRTFMELSDKLVDWGMDREDMPQIVTH